MIKINCRIKSKPHAHLQTMEKRCAKLRMKKGLKLYKELRLQGTYCLYTFIKSEVRKWQSSRSEKSDKNSFKGYIQTTCTSQDHGENMCKFQKLMQGLYPNHMHIFRSWRKHGQSFKKIGIKLYEELRSQGTHCLYIEVEKLLSSQSGKSDKK